jgi:hypothetical protein
MLGQSTPFFHQVMHLCDQWGNAASVIGLFVSIIGFVWALRGIVTAKRAAQNAELAANHAKESILKAAAIENFATSFEIMEDIKRQIRAGIWEDCLSRLAQLRRILVELRISRSGVNGEQEMIIASAIGQFLEIENKIEQCVGGKPAPNAAKLNGIVSKQMDKLQEISLTIKQKIGD